MKIFHKDKNFYLKEENFKKEFIPILKFLYSNIANNTLKHITVIIGSNNNKWGAEHKDSHEFTHLNWILGIKNKFVCIMYPLA